MTLFTPSVLDELTQRFGKRLLTQAPLSNLTSARVGGAAAYLVTIQNGDELAQTVQLCWENRLPYRILGAGSNMLFSDDGFDGLILLNKAKAIRILEDPQQPMVWAESGANFGLVARKAALAGLSGLEWAAAVPGTVGGAVYGNAGAHGGDIAGSLVVAEILQQGQQKQSWSCEDFAYAYRSSILKRGTQPTLILSATFKCTPDDPDAVQDRMKQYSEHRRRTQPPGASMGSMFKNPVGDYAGRLIEAAGLKGRQVGGVKVSEVHANFFVNQAQATAEDIWTLIQIVQKTVAEKFNVQLELEIEPVGFDHKNNKILQNTGV